MLRRQLKLGFKVLLRRKFFTAVSLFGISFTLLVLLLVTALFDHVFAPHPPEVHQDRSLYVMMVKLWGTRGSSSGQVGFGLIDKHLRDIPGVEELTIFSMIDLTASYMGDRRTDLFIKRTDGAFWRIFRFDFVEGGPFGDQDDASGRPVAVINESTRRELLPEGPAVGREIEIGRERFEVVGVVRDVPILRVAPFSDVWVPVGTLPRSGFRHELRGGFGGVMLVESEAAIPAVQARIQERVEAIPLPDPKSFQHIALGAETMFETVSRAIFSPDLQESRPGLLATVIAGAMLLFMVLPSLNLVNINLSRILERTSEIGVRKAFGAPTRSLIAQFVVENLLLTLIGTLLALGLGTFVLAAINQSGLIPYAQLALNFRVVVLVFGIALTFGLMSGVYPAWRMARLHPVQALRGRSS